MKQIRCNRLLALAVVLLISFTARAGSIDSVLVVVNDEVITNSEFQERLRAVLYDLQSRNAKLPPEDLLKRQVLERMINDKIQLQLAERRGIKVDDERLEKAMQGIAQNNKMTVDQLKDKVAREGLSFKELQQHIRSQIIISELVEREVTSRADVTEEEVDTMLAAGRVQTAPSEFNVSHILIRLPASSKPGEIEKAHAQAEKVLEKLRGGMEFNEAVVAYSQANDALEGGRLGWRKSSQLPALFINALQQLKPGEYTDILRSPNGFHILRLNERRGAAGSGSGSVVETHARHILIRTDAFLSTQEATRRLERIRDRVVNGDDFAELARAHSDDPVSSVNGGDLGWLLPGQTVRSFEEAMNNLKVNEVSQPVQSPYGVHLIQVLERRDKSMGDEVDRNQARQELRVRKANERYEQWIRQLRDEAYVHILTPTPS